MAAALYSLDEARPMSRAGRLTAWLGGALYLGASLGVFSRGSDPWPALLWIPIAHALVLVVVCGLTSLLLYGRLAARAKEDLAQWLEPQRRVDEAMVHREQARGSAPWDGSHAWAHT